MPFNNKRPEIVYQTIKLFEMRRIDHLFKNSLLIFILKYNLIKKIFVFTSLTKIIISINHGA